MIITITLNPAVDDEYIVPAIEPGGWFRATKVEHSPGGKGINVSLILKQMGYDSVAMGFLAGFTGAYIRDALKRLKITTNFVNIHGYTRTNTFIIDEATKTETGMSEKGPIVTDYELQRFYKNYARLLKYAKFVVMGGSLPQGVPDDVYRTLCAMAMDRGKRVMLDTYGAPLDEALKSSPTLVKIGRGFASANPEKSMSTMEEITAEADAMHEQGVEWVIASWGTYGNVFSTPQGVYLAQIESEDVVSLLGASDAILAGLIAARAERSNIEQSIRFAMAAAAEDSTHVGKGVRSKSSVEDFVTKVSLKRL